MKSYASLAAAMAAAGAAILLTVAMQPVEAGLLFTFEQVGPDLVVTGSGSVNTTGWSPGLTTAASPSLFRGAPSPANFNVRVGADSPYARYDVPAGSVTGTTGFTFGTVLTQTNATSWSGSRIGFAFEPTGPIPVRFNLPNGYVSNSVLVGTATWPNTTLADWGLTAGQTANFTMTTPATGNPTEIVTLVAIPEPTQMVSVAAVGAAYGAWRLRKRRAHRAGDAVAG